MQYEKIMGINFMARPGINYFDVAKAAQQVTGNGKAPTIELIRGLLGTGSNSTIGTHLREWRKQQDPTQQLAIQANLPEELVALMKGLWEKVVHEATVQIDTIKNDTQNEVLQLKKSINDLQQENVCLQQQHSQDKQNKEGLLQEKAALEQLIINYKSESAAFQPKLEGLSQQLQEKQNRIEELTLQNRQIQANLEHYRESSVTQRQLDQQRMEQQQRELEQIIQQLKVDLTKTSQEKISLKHVNEQLSFEKNNLQMQLDKSTINSETITAKLAKINTELIQQTSAQQHWQAQYVSTTNKLEAQCKKEVELQAEHSFLLKQVATMKGELKELKDQNRTLAQEKWTLGQEKAQLFGQFKQLEARIIAS